MIWKPLLRFQGREGSKLLHSSGAFIIQSLSQQLGAKEVFSELAVALQAEKFGPEFASTIVQSLNILLITSPELIDLSVHLLFNYSLIASCHHSNC